MRRGFALQCFSCVSVNDGRAIAARGQYESEEKEELFSALKMNLMSSDSSGEDDGDEVLVVHPLPLISAEMTAFKCKLDEQMKKITLKHVGR